MGVFLCVRFGMGFYVFAYERVFYAFAYEWMCFTFYVL